MLRLTGQGKATATATATATASQGASSLDAAEEDVAEEDAAAEDAPEYLTSDAYSIDGPSMMVKEEQAWRSAWSATIPTLGTNV